MICVDTFHVVRWKKNSTNPKWSFLSCLSLLTQFPQQRISSSYGKILLHLPIGCWLQLNKTIAKIEKETLLIVLSCEKFHEYVYGLRFVVEKDHKSLISIFQRGMCKPPPRIQRFLLRLQRYNFQLNYVPGNLLFVADILSRLPLPDGTSEIKSDEMNYFVHTVIKSS